MTKYKLVDTNKRRLTINLGVTRTQRVRIINDYHLPAWDQLRDALDCLSHPDSFMDIVKNVLFEHFIQRRPLMFLRVTSLAAPADLRCNIEMTGYIFPNNLLFVRRFSFVLFLVLDAVITFIQSALAINREVFQKDIFVHIGLIRYKC